ncbi:MAG: transglutaminase domain-containing protein [Nitrospinae bacterium]|nr:transglutaminase domain-containing protein [Nitrospinota bacterium]
MRNIPPVGTLLLLAALLIAPPARAETGDPWEGRVYDRLVSEEWFDVRFGEGKIGFSTTSVEEGKEGYRIKGRAVIRLQVLGETQDLSFAQTFHLDKKRQVLGFISLQNAGPQRMRTVGRLDGTRLTLTIGSAAGENDLAQTVPVGIQFLETISFTMGSQLREGFDRTVPVYVTSLRAVEPIRVVVKGRERLTIDGATIDTYRTETTMRGFVTDMWITPDGRTVRERESSIGVVTQRTSRDKALAFADNGIPVTSLITYSLVKPDRKLTRPDRIKRLSILVDGLGTPRDIPRDERQLVGTPLWREVGGKRVMTLPVTLVAKGPERILPLGELREFAPDLVKQTPEIQSEHPEIVSLSRSLTKDALDGWGAALAINRWVNENIKKELVDSFTALDVLRVKKGECQAHTNLFAALARAAGIPTRVTGGLVYSTQADGFLYHAWPEVFVGEWVAMDPTLGESVADATHLKLFDGGLAETIKLIGFVGRIGIRIDEP